MVRARWRLALSDFVGSTRSSTAPRLRALVSTVAGALSSNKRQGRVILTVLGCMAIIVPLLLLVIFALTSSVTGALLGFVLGLIVDLLGLILLLALVSHRVGSQRQRTIRRTVTELVGRTTALENSLAKRVDVLAIETAAARAAQNVTDALKTDLGNRFQANRVAMSAYAAEVGNRVQATQILFALVLPRGLVPAMYGYAASPDVLVVLVHRFLTLRPAVAVECGSGTSTLFLALAAQQYDISCRLIALEHDPEYAAATRTLLAEHGVAHLAEVRDAPLRATTLTDHDGPWYDPAAYEDLHDIGLAFVDGPPGIVGPQARYPMVPLLADRLAARCVILMDDMRRPDERSVGERWLTQLDGFSYRYLPLIRGAGEFTRGC